jgi:hypothetical protein
VAESRSISRQIKLEYCFDRLAAKKLTLAYELLVPDKTWVGGVCQNNSQKVQKDITDEDGCNLRASIIGAPKGRRYDW